MAIISSAGATGPDFGPALPLHRGYLWFIAFTAAMGGLLFGYDWVVIGGAAPFYEAFFKLTSATDQGWAKSCALIGCLMGALTSGALSDRYGRKPLLVMSALIFIGSSLGIADATSFREFVLWRIAGGISIGLASNLSPMYISEIAPAAMRGRLVALNQLTVVIGILLAQVVNLWIAGDLPARMHWADGTASLQLWNEASGWRWMFGVTAIPSLLFLAALLLAPESPRWLIEKGDTDGARSILTKIGGADYAASAAAAIGSATKDAEHMANSFRALLEPKILRVLLLGIGLAIFQQWCGINVIFNYAAEIFQAAGYSIEDTLSNIAWTGSVNLAFTLVAMWLVDRAGRRPLMLAGAAGLMIAYIGIGWCYTRGIHGGAVLVLVLAAIGCYAATLAPVTWVVIAEIFPNRVRGKAMSAAIFCLWSACFVLTYTFPLLNARFGPAATFWVYAGICAAGLLFVWRRLPETKGKSLEQIERELVD